MWRWNIFTKFGLKKLFFHYYILNVTVTCIVFLTNFLFLHIKCFFCFFCFSFSYSLSSFFPKPFPSPSCLPSFSGFSSFPPSFHPLLLVFCFCLPKFSPSSFLPSPFLSFFPSFPLTCSDLKSILSSLQPFLLPSFRFVLLPPVLPPVLPPSSLSPITSPVVVVSLSWPSSSSSSSSFLWFTSAGKQHLPSSLLPPLHSNHFTTVFVHGKWTKYLDAREQSRIIESVICGGGGSCGSTGSSRRNENSRRAVP